MAIINFAHREITAKVVYFGAPDAGCNTNVRKLFDLLPVEEKSRLHRFGPDDLGQSFFFDYVPPGGGLIIGFSTRFRVYSMPGGITHRIHRDEVLRGTDAVVFVADSRSGCSQANLDALIELESLLADLDLALVSIPIVLQLNHTDSPDARPIEDVAYDLNPYGFPVIPAAARHSRGVLETHDAITRSTVTRIQDNLAGNQTAINLTAVHRSSRERDDDVIRRHVDAIRASDASGLRPLDGAPGEDAVLEPGDAPPPARTRPGDRFEGLPVAGKVSVPFQPSDLVGTRPVHLLAARVQDGAIQLEIVVDRLSGGEPRRLTIQLENRPVDREPLNTPTATATPAHHVHMPHATSSLPDELEIRRWAPNDLPPVWYGIGGIIGGTVGGILIGFLLFYG